MHMSSEIYLQSHLETNEDKTTLKGGKIYKSGITLESTLRWHYSSGKLQANFINNHKCKSLHKILTHQMQKFIKWKLWCHKFVFS